MCTSVLDFHLRTSSRIFRHCARVLIRDVCVRVFCLNGDTSNARAGHLEVVTHIKHSATLFLALFVPEYQFGTFSHVGPTVIRFSHGPTYSCSSNID